MRDGASYLGYPSRTFRTQPPSDRFPPDRQLMSISLRVFGRWLTRDGMQWEVVFRGSTPPRVECSMELLPFLKYRLLEDRWCDENHKPPLLFTLLGSALFGSGFRLPSRSVILYYFKRILLLAPFH